MIAKPANDYWRGRRVLLTGHTGFKGSWAALWLAHLGAQVTGFALEPEGEPSLFSLAKVGERISLSLTGDLRDEPAVADAVRRARPQTILHLGAQPLVRRAIAEPVDTIATNVLGTAHLLDAARACEGLEAILVITSDKVYANEDQRRPFTEADALGGKDAYSASKAAAELITRAFARSYFEPAGVRVATARGGNVIGGGDFAQDRIIPDILRATARGDGLALRMPNATRPWQHVLDCVSGYLAYAQALAQSSDTPRALNFGPRPGQDVTVGALATAMLKALGAPATWSHEPVPGSIEMKELAIDSTLARTTLGWSDRLTGDALVQWTAQWHRAHANGADAYALTQQQIVDYERYSI